MKVKFSISINKNQYPGITVEFLLDYFEGQIKNHSYTRLKKKYNSIEFENELGTWAKSRFTNKWTNYNYGKFEIIDKKDLFEIYFFGEMKRAIITSAIPSIILLIISIAAICPLNFGFIIIIILIFPFFFLIRYVLEIISFPIYFNRQKYKIEKLFLEHIY